MENLATPPQHPLNHPGQRSLVFEVGGISLLIPKQIHTLLTTMLQRPGRVFTKRELLAHLESAADAKIIDVQLCRAGSILRNAFPDPDNPPPIQVNAHWGLGHSVTFGPPTAPTSGIRWVPSRKWNFLDTLRKLERQAGPLNFFDSTAPEPDYSRMSEERELAARRLAQHRLSHPEITDEMISQWSQYGVGAR